MGKRMSDIWLSVIIPVFNVEKYIEKNIESLRKLSSEEIEFIYVDDGSSDNSVSIIEKQQALDSRIRVFKKDNSGPGATRNYGLKNSRGKYILFVDSDDYVNPFDTNLIRNILEVNNLDMLEFCYRLVDEKGNELQKPNISDCKMTNRVLSGAQWLRAEKCCSLQIAYFYRKDFMMSNGLLMPEGVIHEDAEYVGKCTWYAKRYMKINECLYNYLMRSDSIMHTKGKQHSADTNLAIYRTIDFANENVDRETYSLYFEPYIITSFYNMMHTLIQNDENVRDFYRKNSKLRKDTMAWLKKSTSISRKFQYYCFVIKAYEIYTLMYKVYDHIRPNYLSPKSRK